MPLARIFDTMISVGTTGITRRCSTVPCSRSRISAAPVRITVIMVRLLMICITAVNQLDFIFGLNFTRVTIFTGAPISPSRPVMNSVT